ncbi:hypothetical protein D3C77_521340 [compost metagenome]
MLWDSMVGKCWDDIEQVIVGPGIPETLQGLNQARCHRSGTVGQDMPNHVLQWVAFRVLGKTLSIFLAPPLYCPHKVHVVAVARSIFCCRPLDLREWVSASPLAGIPIRKKQWVWLPLLLRGILKKRHVAEQATRWCPTAVQPPAGLFFERVSGQHRLRPVELF